MYAYFRWIIKHNMLHYKTVYQYVTYTYNEINTKFLLDSNIYIHIIRWQYKIQRESLWEFMSVILYIVLSWIRQESASGLYQWIYYDYNVGHKATIKLQ